MIFFFLKKHGFFKIQKFVRTSDELPLFKGGILPCSDIPLLPKFGESLILKYFIKHKPLISEECCIFDFFWDQIISVE